MRRAGLFGVVGAMIMGVVPDEGMDAAARDEGLDAVAWRARRRGPGCVVARPGLRATKLNARTAAAGGDPGEAAAGALRLILMEDDGPTGQLFSWDGSVAPW